MTSIGLDAAKLRADRLFSANVLLPLAFQPGLLHTLCIFSSLLICPALLNAPIWTTRLR